MSEEVTNTGSEESVVAESTVAETTTDTSAELNFKEYLADDLKDHAALADIKDINALAKSYVSAQTMIGGSVRIPGEDASLEQREEFYSKLESVGGVVRLPDPENEEAVNAFYKQLGRPDSAADYKLDLPEGMSIEGKEYLVEAAHKAGLTNDQLRVLTQAEVQQTQAQMQALEESRTAGEKVLNEVFGQDKEARLAGAKAAARVYSEKYPEAVNELINGPAGNNPALVMMLADLGKTLQETGHEGLKSSPKYGMTPDDAQMKIDEIMNNPGHAYFDERSPDHQAALDKMRKLYQVRYPG